MDASADAAFMQIASALGRRGEGNTWPNPCVGCVIVKTADYGPLIVGRGWTAPGGRPHAETKALNRAGVAAKGATLYVTLEPCSHVGKTPPCATAIIDAGIKRVVCALEDPDDRVAGRGFAMLRDAGIEVEIGVGAKAAHHNLSGHLTRIVKQRPHVHLKLAISKNKKIAGKGGKQIWITGEPVRGLVHAMRARHDAIMVGAGTVRADNPDLTCRLPGLEASSPVRVIVDTHLSIETGSKLCLSAAQVPVWVLTSENASAERASALRKHGVEIIPCPVTEHGQVDLRSGLARLAKKGITSLLVEGGAKLAASLFEDKLVDEADFFFSEREIDEDGIDALYGMELSSIIDSPDFTFLSSRPVGADTQYRYVRT